MKIGFDLRPNLALAALLALAVLGIMALQMPRVDRPPFDAHAFRQAQTLSTIELFAKDGIDLFHPKTNYMGEPGFFVLELPLFQALCGLLYGWFGDQVWIVRTLNLLFTAANAGLTFAIGKRLFGRESATIAVLFYLFAPLNLVYMASTLIDPSATTFSLAGFYFGHRILHPQTVGSLRRSDWLFFSVASAITALIKTLYLFPICVLIAMTFLSERRLKRSLIGAGGCVGIGILLSMLWLHHARHVNDASYFTRGVNPTSLLGVEVLGELQFYRRMTKRFLIELAGPVGGLLAVFGWVSALPRRTAVRRELKFPLSVLALSVIGYWITFAHANFPHDYYSLVISPYVCIVAGFGAREAVHLFRQAFVFSPSALCVAAVGLSALLFLKRGGGVASNSGELELQLLSRGHFDRWAFGMVFARPDDSLPVPMYSDAPELLYATGLRGTGRAVPDETAAVAIWNEQRPHYRNLKYVVFYRLEPPAEIVKQCREAVLIDREHALFAYRVE